jgi:hypothetical protein
VAHFSVKKPAPVWVKINSHLLNREHFKQSRAAALAEWRGLLAA